MLHITSWRLYPVKAQWHRSSIPGALRPMLSKMHHKVLLLARRLGCFGLVTRCDQMVAGLTVDAPGWLIRDAFNGDRISIINLTAATCTSHCQVSLWLASAPQCSNPTDLTALSFHR